MIQAFANQLFHQRDLPLDSSQEVERVEDLNNTDKTVGYQGKLVHVKSENKIYLCIGTETDPTTGAVHSTWTPLFKDDGTAFYLRAADDGSIFEIKAVRDGAGNKGRIEVSYPA